MIYKKINFTKELDKKSLGYKIDLLIRSNIRNWKGKEYLNKKYTKLKVINKYVLDAFKANKVRNKMITEINYNLHHESKFHFRNYHNY